MTSKLIRRLAREPRKLFLLDGIGAMVSFFALVLIEEFFSDLFGMPKSTLTFLAGIAVCLFAYSTLCFLLLKKNYAPYSLGITLANSAYCLLTMGLTAYFYSQLTALGVAYFILEIIVIFILVYTEWRVFRLLTHLT
jgi:hypothetical protein